MVHSYPKMNNMRFVAHILRRRQLSPQLLDHQYRTVRELDNPISSAADQSFVQRRMAGCADDEQLGLKLLGKFDNVPHRMSGDDMDVKFDMIFLGLCPRPLLYFMKAPRCRPGLLTNLLDELRHVVDLFDAHHVQL